MGDLTPVDYSVAVANPFQSAMQGYAQGAAIRDDQQNQVLKQQQQQAQQQQQQVIQGLAAKVAAGTATPNDYAGVMTAIPAMAEPLTKTWAVQNPAQQQAALSDALQWGNAIATGHNDVAISGMNNRADLMDAQNGGQPTQQSQALRAKAQLIAVHPDMALGGIQAMVATYPDADKAASSLASLQKARQDYLLGPSQLEKSQADASKAATDATVASATAPAQIQKPTLDNSKTAQDIAASQAQQNINALNVQIAQANSETDRGKLVLERDQWQQKADQLKQGQTAQATGALDGLNNARFTVNALLNHPALDMLTGGLGRTKPLPATNAYDFNSLIGTLKSQQFLSQLDALKQTSANGSAGLGALSDSEGDRLSNSIANLDPSQSNAQLRTNLNTILKTLDRAQAKIVANGKLPGTTPSAGGAVVTSHPTYGIVTDAQINALLQKYPGATRDQVMQFLSQQPGQ